MPIALKVSPRVRRLARFLQRLDAKRVITIQSSDPEEFELHLWLAAAAGFDRLPGTTIEAVGTTTRSGRVRITHVAHLIRLDHAPLGEEGFPTHPTSHAATSPPHASAMDADWLAGYA